MQGKKILIFAMCFLMLLPMRGISETLEEQVARLTQELAQKDAYIAELESRIAFLESQYCEYSPDDIAAEFAGGSVTVGTARAEYEYRAYYYEMFGVDVSEYEAELKREVLENLAEDMILEQKAQEYGVYELDDAILSGLQADAQAQLDEMAEYYRAYRYQDGMTEEELRQDTLEYLKEEGYSLDSILESLISQSWRQRLRDFATKDVVLTEDDLYAYYVRCVNDQQTAFAADAEQYDYAQADGNVLLWNPEGVRAVRYILIGFDEEAISEYVSLMEQLESNPDENALQRLNALYAEIYPKAQEIYSYACAGWDFLGLCDDYSDDTLFLYEPWRSNGMYIQRGSRVTDSALTEAVMALEYVGSITEPIQGDGGYYIGLYMADVPSGAAAYDAVKDDLRASALEEKLDSVYNALVEQWVEQANVQYYPERL